MFRTKKGKTIAISILIIVLLAGALCAYVMLTGRSDRGRSLRILHFPAAGMMRRMPLPQHPPRHCRITLHQRGTRKILNPNRKPHRLCRQKRQVLRIPRPANPKLPRFLISAVSRHKTGI